MTKASIECSYTKAVVRGMLVNKSHTDVMDVDGGSVAQIDVGATETNLRRASIGMIEEDS